jgi:uncharacterized SAM-binding protein YcdF (DUF218 family)
MPRRFSFPWRAFWLLAAVLFGFYVGSTYRSVAKQAYTDETRPAQAIVVFGAAEYNGRPSPVFKARLDHALQLYRNKIAPMVITTGSSKDAKFTEGGVGRDYLIGEGVPETAVIAETQSTDTSDQAERVASILKKNGSNDCVAVSDGYHMFRIKQMMAKQGIVAYGAPRYPAKPFTTLQRTGYYLREVLSLTLWRLHIT